MNKKIIGIFFTIIILLAAIQVTGEYLKYKSSIENKEKNNGFFSREFVDVGVGIPTNLNIGQTLFLGNDNLFVTIINDGDISTAVNLDFLLEKYNDNEWSEIDSGGNGPYELDPEAWVESFFDVFFDTEGEYRATFSLDTPLRGNWSDDNPENDVFQVIFFVINPLSFHEWYVDDDASSGGDGSKKNPFQKISEAITTANSGDKIWVMNGVYDEQILIDKENLDISSAYNSAFIFSDDNKTVLDWNDGSIVIINKPFTRITGFVIQNCGNGEEDAAVDITSDYNFISWNLIENNGATGIYLHDSSNNNYIHHNVIKNNNGAGMFIWQQSKNNWIYHNDFINNIWYNVKDKEGENIWDYSYPYGGNYWDDFTGKDENGDGIGETPYEIMGDFIPTGSDKGPWVEPHKWNDHSVIKKINGPSTGKPGDKYGFEFTMIDENFGPGSDPFEEHVYCRVSWGEGNEEILGPYYLDTIANIEHTWNNSGTFTIQAKVIDGYDLESDEATFEVTMPRNRQLYDNMLLSLLDRLSDKLPILQKLIYRLGQ